MIVHAGMEPVARARGRSPRWWRRTQLIARRANLFLWLEIIAAFTLAVMLASSYLMLTSFNDPRMLVPSAQAAAMMVGTLIPALALLVLIGRRLAIRRAGGTTARLHVNLVFFFSLVAAIPTLLVAVFASFLFQSGVEFWFSDKSRGILENADELARGYYDENQREMGAHAAAMSADLRFFLQDMTLTDPEFQEQYVLQVYSRELSESAILLQEADGSWRVAAIVDPGEDTATERISPAMAERLRSGEAVIVTATQNQIEAVTPLDPSAGMYLHIVRDANPLAFSQWRRAQSVIEDYDTLARRARVLQLEFNLALFGVSLALVGLAVWFALRFADRQVHPLAELVTAARAVASGNYALRVTGRTGNDEIGLLNRAFNRMTAQIERQTAALLGANRQLAERRAFIEAVLQSISAGIVSLDAQGRVILMNASAANLLLGPDAPSPIGAELEPFAPQLTALLKSGAGSGTVQLSRDGELLTLAVKLAPAAEGHVITFEDITRQLLDQRQAAWSDVAQRIAHEIKNPLTPIQLATERIKRRYRKQILEDGELFEELTATIIRQVGDLRTMVDEFSSFARLPKPVFRREDALELVRQALFLQQVAHPQIEYVLVASEGSAALSCDRHQFGQAMVNVLKNAAEAIGARRRERTAPDVRGRIEISLEPGEEQIAISVTDNGIGLPAGGERIMEPYVTTREKGTGLGLAIVKKIVEEHGGEISFAPAPEVGARATLRFSRDPLALRVAGREAAE